MRIVIECLSQLANVRANGVVQVEDRQLVPEAQQRGLGGNSEDYYKAFESRREVITERAAQGCTFLELGRPLSHSPYGRSGRPLGRH